MNIPDSEICDFSGLSNSVRATFKIRQTDEMLNSIKMANIAQFSYLQSSNLVNHG